MELESELLLLLSDAVEFEWVKFVFPLSSPVPGTDKESFASKTSARSFSIGDLGALKEDVEAVRNCPSGIFLLGDFGIDSSVIFEVSFAKDRFEPVGTLEVGE